MLEAGWLDQLERREVAVAFPLVAWLAVTPFEQEQSILRLVMNSVSKKNSVSKRTIWFNRFTVILGSALLLLAVVAILAWIGWTKMEQVKAAMASPPPPEMPVAVTLFEPQKTEFRRETVVVGSVLAPQSVRLRNELTGVVTEVAMEPGGIVRAGQLLVQLDDRTERAQLKAATASLKLALASLERSKQLSRANASTDQELDVAQAEAVRAEAEIERLKTLIDRKRIVARFDARVGLFQLNVGQYLVEGTEIATLEGIADYLHVDFAMPAHVADGIGVGESVTVQATADATATPAEIIAIDASSNPITRSLLTRAKVVNPPATLMPGDSLRVTIQYGDAVPALLVPATAIRRGPSGTLVYIAKQTSMTDEGATGNAGELRAIAKSVQIAGGGGTFTRVIGGISATDLVVADGSFKVTEGALLADSGSPPTTSETLSGAAANEAGQ